MKRIYNDRDLWEEYLPLREGCNNQTHSYSDFKDYKITKSGSCGLDINKAKDYCQKIPYQYWDEDIKVCKENLFWKCVYNKTMDWSFEDNKCKINPIKVCEESDDSVWNYEKEVCEYSQDKINQKVIEDCLSDGSKYWDGNSCVSADSLK